MNLPFRRRGRPRGTPRLAAVNDTQATREWLSRIRTDPADGTTWHQPATFGGSSDIGVMTAPAGRPGEDTEPITRHRPAAVLPMPQARAVMTVYPPGPGVPAPTPEAVEVVRYLRARVLILGSKSPPQLDRVSDEKLRLVPGDRATNRRTTARLIVDEAVQLLRCGGDAS